MLSDPGDPSQGNMGRYANLVQHAFRSMSYMPMAFITAKTGKNVKALLNLSQSLYKQSLQRVGTGTLNRVLREAVDAHPPASRENRTPRVYYATQVDVAPPTIVLFVNSTRLFDPTYQRYLLNVFRQKLPFHDVPIKLYLRSRKPQEPGGRSSAGGQELAEAFADASGNGDGPDQTVTAYAGGSSDPSLRFLHHEVNELLADSDD
jgi:GTPase